MRYALIFALLLTLTLTGCGGGDAATATPETPQIAPTLDNGDSGTTQPPAQTPLEGGESFGEGLATNPPSIAGITPELIIVPPFPTAEGGLPLEDVGTLVFSTTQDPEAAFPFESITLVRKGGPANPDGTQAETYVILYSDGRIIRDGREGRADPAIIERLNQYVREMNFFGAAGNFMGPLGADDITTFTYSVTVRRAGTEKALNGMDGFMPPEFERIISTLILEGQKVPG